MANPKNSKTIHSSASPSSSHHVCASLLSRRPLRSSSPSSAPSTFLFWIAGRAPTTARRRDDVSLRLPLLFLSLSLSLLLLGAFSLLAVSGSRRPTRYTPSAGDDSCDHRKRSGRPPLLSKIAMAPLPVHGFPGNLTAEEREFWRQPDGTGYRPCIEFSVGYRKASARITGVRRKFLVAVVSGGLNQQRNQIVDAVVIARILGAAMVVPVLKADAIWRDDSKFSDIFDEEHFKITLQSDVHIVSSLPSEVIAGSPEVEKRRIPFNVSPLWIRRRFLKQLYEKGVLKLDGLDSKLSRTLPLDLQKLRCKVAFHALRFAEPIRELGEELARRMWAGGPYVAVHLRLEEDAWVSSGCLPGLGPEHDDVVARAPSASWPELLTTSGNVTHERRRLAGLCPLNGREVARLLRALGAPGGARVYGAGGTPLGGELALRPLKAEFPNLLTKETLARDGELRPLANRSSALAAIDYMVSLSSDVFMPSHGGNMARALQGHRAFSGHRKCIRPNKRALLGDESLAPAETIAAIRRAHRESVGGPEPRTTKGRDVIAYPVPECMCRRLRFFVF